MSELEPNDSPGQAQTLDTKTESALLGIEGVVGGQSDPQDIFKLVVPGGAAEVGPGPALDSAAPDDPRRTARRLGVEIAAEGDCGVALRLLDEGLKVIESVAAEVGESAGMPNMAVQPGRSYYVGVKAAGKAGQQAAATASCKYKLQLELGAFDVADEREPNGTLESADFVAMAGVAELAGYYGWNRDQDFYRLLAPEVSSALDVVVDGVEGVTPALQVLSGNGSKLAAAKGRRGEKLALHNVRIGAGAMDAGAGSLAFFVVVKGESGQNRGRRYVLHLSLGAVKQDTEVEPNDAAGNATPIGDGALSGFLPASDVDYFLYDSAEPREITVELALPARMRGKLEISRLSKSEVIATAETKKARQQIRVSRVLSLGQPLLLRLAPIRSDGNAIEPYRIAITSTPSTSQTQKPEIRIGP